MRLPNWNTTTKIAAIGIALMMAMGFWMQRGYEQERDRWLKEEWPGHLISLTQVLYDEYDGNGHVSFAEGPSMRPTIESREPYLVVYTPFEEVRAGDIIVYEVRGSPATITHRVISRTENRLRTRGDNNPEPDRYPVREENYVGRVVLVEED